jgi:23S rRNA (uridine2552-2'-O)-methyltransferase
MTRRSASSQRWRQRQDKDPYVERAARGGWRSRAVFKLEEIDRRERLLRPGIVCVDLGAAPGAWSQFVARRIGPTGRVVAVDLLPMEPIPGVDFLQGDFTAPDIRALVLERVGPGGADLVLSDMAPNLSGNSAMDIPRQLELAEATVAFAVETLQPGGALVVKMFQGEGFDAFVRQLRGDFGRVRLVKPKASRAESREIYLLARKHGM